MFNLPGLKSSFFKDTNEVKAFEADADIAELVVDAADDGRVLQVRPYPENEGMAASESLLGELYNLRQAAAGFVNNSDTMAFEMWHDNGEILFAFYVPNSRCERRVRKQVDAYYPDSEIINQTAELGGGVADDPTVGWFPNINRGDHIAASELFLERSTLYPIKNPYGVREFNFDPYRGLTTAMNIEQEKRLVVQIVFRPTDETWAEGGRFHSFNPAADDIESVADSLRNEEPIPELFEGERAAISEERQLAEKMTERKDRDAFQVNIRIVGLSEDPTIGEHVWDLGQTFHQDWQETQSQAFIQEPATSRRQMSNVFERAVNRRLVDNGIVLTTPELASVSHIPNEGIETSEVSWNTTQKGARLPADAERFINHVRDKRERFNIAEDANDGEQSTTDTTADTADETSPTARPPPTPTASSEDSGPIPDTPISGEADGGTAANEQIFGFADTTADPTTDAPTEVADDSVQSTETTPPSTAGDAGTNEQSVNPEPDTTPRKNESTASSDYTDINTENGDADGSRLFDTIRRKLGQSGTTTDADDFRSIDEPETSISLEQKLYEKSAEVDTSRFGVDFDQSTATGRAGREITINDTKGNGPYMGRWGRVMVDAREQFLGGTDRIGTLVGYKVEDRPKDIVISHEELFRHLVIYGTTGNGKSTLLNNLGNQWAYGDLGFCYIDPNGDSVRKLLRQLPEKRLDDVIWIDPEAPGRDRVVGFNFLQPGGTDGGRAQEAEINELAEDLKEIVSGDKVWGGRMARVFRTIIQTMARRNVDPEAPNYTLIDVYNILTDKEYREKLPEVADDEVLKKYAEVIAEEHSTDDLDALIGRISKYVHNRITREIVGQKESSVNIKDAVESGKIILVDNDTSTEEGAAQRLVAVGLVRRIWSAVRARTEPEEERSPFMLIMDEFDSIVQSDINVSTMLSEARKYRLSLTLAMQHPEQINDNEELRKEMESNAKNLVSFGVDGHTAARSIAQRFDGLDASDVKSLDQYEAWTTVPTADGSRSSPLVAQMFPDYPPVRTAEKADGIIEHSLERYGSERMDPDEIVSDENLVTGGEAPDTAEELVNADATDNGIDGGPSVNRVLEAIHSARVRQNVSRGGYVPAEAVAEAVDERTTDDVGEFETDQMLEDISSAGGSPVDIRRVDGGNAEVALTDAGRRQLFDADTGGANGGKISHRRPLRELVESFTAAGFHATLPEQEGGDPLPDGIATVPYDISADNPTEMERKRRDFQQMDHMPRVTDGRDVAIEYESTTKSRPVQTIKNLRGALEDGYKCVFAVSDGEDDVTANAEKVRRIIEDPAFVRNTADSGETRRFYTERRALRVGDGHYKALQPTPDDDDTRGDTVWTERKDGSVRCSVAGGESVALFDTAEAVSNATRDYFPAIGRYDQSIDRYVVMVNNDDTWSRTEFDSEDDLKEEWREVSKPFIPEVDFEVIPPENDYEIVVVPSDDRDIGLQLYTDDDLEPLFDFEPRPGGRGGLPGDDSGSQSEHTTNTDGERDPGVQDDSSSPDSGDALNDSTDSTPHDADIDSGDSDGDTLAPAEETEGEKEPADDTLTETVDYETTYKNNETSVDEEADDEGNFEFSNNRTGGNVGSNVDVGQPLNENVESEPEPTVNTENESPHSDHNQPTEASDTAGGDGTPNENDDPATDGGPTGLETGGGAVDNRLPMPDRYVFNRTTDASTDGDDEDSVKNPDSDGDADKNAQADNHNHGAEEGPTSGTDNETNSKLIDPGKVAPEKFPLRLLYDYRLDYYHLVVTTHGDKCITACEGAKLDAEGWDLINADSTDDICGDCRNAIRQKGGTLPDE